MSENLADHVIVDLVILGQKMGDSFCKTGFLQNSLAYESSSMKSLDCL